ncbi:MULTISPECIES: pyridoxal-phosphate-dependent aminotransferase family protein [Staphylococcus]|uniref:pyridoxal-phosphate-dependent aminotransferase family protein n=1 Tax=Staphylococcus TaxID=1279 RepID=UPI000D1AD395|nr:MULTISPECIES: alanine--glyoxylate aminotransferase family protein [Staphylococcus]NHM75772.1 alanine--glyoxylate aminotransferase family protein [Staphylococcus sp. 11007852]NJH83382.1 aminotransferase class V-fold PLP-dependent enzyme [Staphylococcus agnetis]NJH86297.1 aminotransferase class V-fold PLP-dependent enzyme [Staphylococcus agnetis]NJI15998.1 aminotransferase class V-fold PLP-dependent enzyme [Staphylococcus agnetis]PTH41496.1 aminotransferase [Staphylococcus agnetis]
MYFNHTTLLTPGPTPVTAQIQAEMNLPMVGHRSSDFEMIAKEAFQALKVVFGSQHDVMILSSSGTSALEASMVNLLEAEDHIVVIVSGAFGNRFKQIAQTYYSNVHVFDVTWGEAFDTKAVIDFIKNINHRIKAVFTQFCETSTAVLHPVAELGVALKQLDDALFYVVDGVSCIGAVDVDMQRDAIDVLVSGSQKAMGLPPGIAFVAYNERALRAFQQNQTPKFYLDLSKHYESLKASSTPYTPNITAFRGVNAYMRNVNELGLKNVIQQHYQLRDAVRSALKALDLNLLVNDAVASPTVTAFIPKNKEELQTIKNELKAQFNITIAGGQGYLKGQILRVGHMADVSPFTLLSFIAALELILTKHRQTSLVGKGTTAFMEVLKDVI